MKIGSLFSGAGGLDLAVEAVFVGRTVWHCEPDPAASKVLAHRWPGVPNLGDITAVDWATVEPIDVLCGGFPCQDVSSAGRRAGIREGTRSGLWSHFADAIDVLRPPVVVIENVRGLLSAKAHRAMESGDTDLGDGSGGPVLRAAGAVLGDLADLGYDAQWSTVAAASVGAPHRRERVFILAVDATRESGGVDNGDCLCTGGPAEQHRSDSGASAATDTDNPTIDRQRSRPESGQRGAVATDADRAGGEALSGRPRAGDTGRPQPMERGGENGAGQPVADAAGDGRHEGWPESTRFVGRSDAALSGDGPVALLPTPMSRDWRGSSEADENRHSPNMSAIAALLPTPASADAERGPDFARANRDGSGGDDLVTICSRASRQRGCRWGKYEAVITRWETLTRPAPSPTEPNRSGNPRLAAAFAEWVMGWPAGWVTDPAIGISRNNQLRIIGNGVVPQQAYAAISGLLNVCGVAA